MNPSNLAIVNEASTGVVVYWSLSGDTDGSKLIDAWQASGLPLDMLPSLPSADAALRRAVADQREKHLLARKHSDGAWYLVRENTDGEVPDYKLGIKFWLDDFGNVRSELCSIGQTYSNVSLAVVQQYEHYRNVLSTQDISSWLCRLTTKVGGLTLRPETGGFYYIPNYGLDVWQRAEAAIKAASTNSFYSIPAMKCEQAAEAILDALNAEVESEAKTLMQELTDGELGERALKRRVTQTEATRSKVAAYENLLGTKLDGLRTKLEELASNVTIAALAAAAETDKREAAVR